MSQIIPATENPALLKSDSQHTEEPDPEIPRLAATSFDLIPPQAGGGPLDNPIDPLLQLLRLDAGNTLVNQTSRVVFHLQGNEALRAIVESFLVDITWVSVFTRHNFTNSPIEEVVRVLTRRTVISGSETNRELNLGAAYNGLSIGFGMSSRTFSSTETVSEREVTTTYTIPPQSSLHVYQRRYRFREEIWWIADAWNDLWNVSAPPSGFTLLRVPFESFIHADERMAINRPLSGSARAPVTSGPLTYLPHRQIFRQFPNHTQRTRNAVQRVINDSNRRALREEQIV